MTTRVLLNILLNKLGDGNCHDDVDDDDNDGDNDRW